MSESVQYLQFLHLSLHGKPIHHINTNSDGAEVILGCAEPVGKGSEDTLSLFNARHLLLQLFDCLLQCKGRRSKGRFRMEKEKENYYIFTVTYRNTDLQKDFKAVICVTELNKESITDEKQTYQHNLLFTTVQCADIAFTLYCVICSRREDGTSKCSSRAW